MSAVIKISMDDSTNQNISMLKHDYIGENINIIINNNEQKTNDSETSSDSSQNLSNNGSIDQMNRLNNNIYDDVNLNERYIIINNMSLVMSGVSVIWYVIEFFLCLSGYLSLDDDEKKYYYLTAVILILLGTAIIGVILNSYMYGLYRKIINRNNENNRAILERGEMLTEYNRRGMIPMSELKKMNIFDRCPWKFIKLIYEFGRVTEFIIVIDYIKNLGCIYNTKQMCLAVNVISWVTMSPFLLLILLIILLLVGFCCKNTSDSIQRYFLNKKLVNFIKNHLLRTVITPSNMTTEYNCAVCLGEPEIGEEWMTLECGHKYHVSCINEWLTRQNSCPTCRKQVIRV